MLSSELRFILFHALLRAIVLSRDLRIEIRAIARVPLPTHRAHSISLGVEPRVCSVAPHGTFLGNVLLVIARILTVLFELTLSVDVFDTIFKETPIADAIDIAAIAVIQISVLVV